MDSVTVIYMYNSQSCFVLFTVLLVVPIASVTAICCIWCWYKWSRGSGPFTGGRRDSVSEGIMLVRKFLKYNNYD